FWNSGAVVPVGDLGHLGMDDIHRIVARIGEEARSGPARRYMERVEASPSVRAYLGRALAPYWSDRFRIVSDPPDKRAGAPGDGWLVARIDAGLRAATRAALLVSPYFVPGVHAGHAHIRGPLLERGVPRLDAPQDAAAPQTGGRPRAGRAGSSGASLDTKAFVVDGRRGFIGSYDPDPPSARLNTEMGVF